MNPSTTLMTLDEIVMRERERLQLLIQKGRLPHVYGNDFEAFLCDWGPDFSWNEYMLKEMEALLRDTEWLALSEQFKALTGHDFKWAAEETIRTAFE